MTDRDDIIERLAALEAREEARDAVIAEMAKNQKEILEQLNRYKGAWGVIVMVASAIWAAVTFIIPLAKAKGIVG